LFFSFFFVILSVFDVFTLILAIDHSAPFVNQACLVHPGSPDSGDGD